MKFFAWSKTDGVVAGLATTIFLAPVVGVPSELMLQDTLKSMVVSFGALLSALVFFWGQRSATAVWRWHQVMWLPLSLMAYALGSMAWSHAYLAGVEAIRWFIFSLLLWLGINCFKRDHFSVLANAIHWGAVLASLWAVLQFLVDLRLFPQGPNPASTFVNRNFFAEFVVCTVPFSVWLVSQARGLDQLVLRVFLTAFNVVALMMTGTRSALLALGVLTVLLAGIAWRKRGHLVWSGWSRQDRWIAALTFMATIYGLGSVPTGNSRLQQENWGDTAIERTFSRVSNFSVDSEFTSGSGSVRLVMWKATGRMIQDRPLTGVGAGAWEVDIPLYQVAGSQLETDFYAHNEYLQLLGEYGLVGWFFLCGLLLFLIRVARQIWASGDSTTQAFALASLVALLLVSGAGFPWRMATTGALFAVLLGVLAAQDAKAVAQQAPKVAAHLGVAAIVGSLALAGYISQQAALAEYKIITAVKMALSISASGAPSDARWDSTKARMLTLVDEGIAITPHYRKITPSVADQLATWGEWKHAIPIWQSVVSSRPFIVAVLSNIGRGYMNLKDVDSAIVYLARAKAINAEAPAVRTLEVVVLTQSGQEAQALELTRKYLRQGSFDAELLNVAISMGTRAKDWPLVIQALTLRSQGSAALASDSWLRIGNIYLNELKSEEQALTAFRAGVAAAPELYRPRVRERVPDEVRNKL